MMAIKETDDQQEEGSLEVLLHNAGRRRPVSPDRLVKNPGMEKQIQDMFSPANHLA